MGVDQGPLPSASIGGPGRGGLLVPATVWNSAREFFFCFNSSQ